MASPELDVVIVGAGAAGLTALAELRRVGVNAFCLEARDRIGGRILTVHDPLSPVPIELGAEFIHGRPPEIWDALRSSALAAYDCGEKAVHIANGKPRETGDAWALVGRVMEDMQRSAEKNRDQTFAEFLEQSAHSDDAKRLAAGYVEGFNAARKEVVGIASLAQDERAAEEIGGDRSFRNLRGYDSLLEAIVRGIDDLPSRLRLSSIVERIEWRAGSATVHTRSALDGHVEAVRCRRVVVTVPLGVLQAERDASGAIRFEPEPAEILAAARKLRFGQVIRVVLRFREAFWERKQEFAGIGFFLSERRFFPTWWTTLPIRAPVITGWSAGPHVDGLLDLPRSDVVAHAIEDLACILGFEAERLGELVEAAYFHDWHADPFSRGAYSYVPAGALPARATLAESVADTLFFAGEATEQNGHSATVHGAIASGKRAARQILERR